MNEFVSLKELANMLKSPILAEELSFSHGCYYVVVDPNSQGDWEELPFQSRCPIIALENGSPIPPEAPIDLSCDASRLDDILEAITAQRIRSFPIVSPRAAGCPSDRHCVRGGRNS